MTKYAFITELVKAGCDIDRLSKETISLIESITNEDKKTSTSVSSDTSSVKGELMQAINTLGVLSKQPNSYILSCVRNEIDRKEYSRAMDDLSSFYSSYFGTHATEDAIKAYNIASRCIGNLM